MPYMEIRAMREQKALLAEKLDRLTRELDTFVRANMGIIRTMLVHYEDGVPSISEDELLCYFVHRLSSFVDSTSEGIKNTVRVRETGWVEKLSGMLMMECLYASFLGGGDVRKNDCYVECMLDLRSGKLHIESMGEVLSVYDFVGAIKAYPALDQLFSKRIVLSVGVESLKWHVFVKKLELGIRVVRACCSRSEEELVPSYKRYREDGFDILIGEEEIVNEEFREKGRSMVEEELRHILHENHSPRRKILLANYMLILFIGLRDVDLSMFEEMDDFYLLLWTHV
jgi:hypothetical protein